MLWFKKKEKAELDAAVRAVGKYATALIVESSVPENHVFPVTATHFGGNPYFEEKDAWPTLGEEKRPFDFVCQINLRDCPDHPNVPIELFTVFVSWAAIEDGDIDRACLVRGYREASADKIVSVRRPTPIKKQDYKVRPCSVLTERLLTYPWSPKKYPEIVAAAAKFSDPNAAYRSSLKRLGFTDQFRSRIGGFPTWVHNDSLEYSDLIFLAQIDYEPKANNCIGDAAPIYIAVSASDPAKFETDVWQSH
ncbi:MAG: DUF1963 domain-containing protein [Planctomycetes bacterium]|nr:DUF1963 domain-containing protein [Planctomycetota bacterium]